MSVQALQAAHRVFRVWLPHSPKAPAGPLQGSIQRTLATLSDAGFYTAQIDPLLAAISRGHQIVDGRSTLNHCIRIAGQVTAELVRRNQLTGSHARRIHELVRTRASIRETDVLHATIELDPTYLQGFLEVYQGTVDRHRAIPLQRGIEIYSKALSELCGRKVFLMRDDEAHWDSASVHGQAYFLLSLLMHGINPHGVRLIFLGNVAPFKNFAHMARCMGFSKVEAYLIGSPEELHRHDSLTHATVHSVSPACLRQTLQYLREKAADDPCTFLITDPEHPLSLVGQACFVEQLRAQVALHHEGLFVLVTSLQERPWFKEGFLRLHPDEIIRVDEPYQAVYPDVVAGAIAFFFDHQQACAPWTAVAAAHILYGGLHLDNDANKAPIVIVSEEPRTVPDYKTALDRFSRGRWTRDLVPIRARLHRSLEENGFLEKDQNNDGGKPTIRNLESPQEGIGLIRLLSRLIPPTWSLLDIFELTDFGPWRADLAKDINASLRNYTREVINEREDITDTLEALVHPIMGRGTTISSWMMLYNANVRSFEEILTMAKKNHGPLPLILDRLEVEIFILALYLEQFPEWLLYLKTWPTQEACDSFRRMNGQSISTIRIAIKWMRALLQQHEVPPQ
jgi:hypothetical protein